MSPEPLPPLFTGAKSFNNSGWIRQSGAFWVSQEHPGVTQVTAVAPVLCVQQGWLNADADHYFHFISIPYVLINCIKNVTFSFFFK